MSWKFIQNMGHKIGVADTTFARVDMAQVVKKAIDDSLELVEVERYAVPGIKDLPVAAKKLLQEYQCDIVLALGMPGDKPIDKTCAHEASQGLIQAQLMTNKHIIEVFIYLDEARTDSELKEIVQNRVYYHTTNALALLKGKEELSDRVGKGIRQGKGDVGGVE